MYEINFGNEMGSFYDDLCAYCRLIVIYYHMKALLGKERKERKVR